MNRTSLISGILNRLIGYFILLCAQTFRSLCFRIINPYSYADLVKTRGTRSHPVLIYITNFQLIYLFAVLRRFQHCTGHITTGSWKGRGNQYIQFVRVLYCKLPTNGKQLPAFPLEAMLGIEPPPQRWEARVLPLCHRGPPQFSIEGNIRSSHYG